jgi:hypothetical protein
MKIYITYTDNFISGAFKNRPDAVEHIRNKCYNSERLLRIKNAISLVYTEEMIIEAINRQIEEIELQ